MSKYIAIDGGTTNTRITFVEDGAILAVKKLALGAKDVMNGTSLHSCIHDAVVALETQYGTPERILAAGMITSDFGLYPVAHISAPSGVRELHQGMKQVVLAQISTVPFCFIPGVKSQYDMMRGEECELMGLGITEPGCSYVLPGSHSKLIHTDDQGRITDIRTFLTGEMLAALSAHTILNDTVRLSEGFCQDALLHGYHAAGKLGINQALFQTRIQNVLLGKDSRECSSFFLGCVLQSELDSILAEDSSSIVLAGQPDIKKAMAFLLTALSAKKVTVIPDDAAAEASVRGMIRIYESEE